jgi:dTDP-4-amino-4,6-dideoxygalactose transaminase
MTNFKSTAHANNYQLDLLGRPIKVGDRVLTKNFGSAALNHFATVLKVNAKSILVNVEHHTWQMDPNTTSWQRKISTKPMKRVGYTDCLVVNELESISTALADDFCNLHPELAI